MPGKRSTVELSSTLRISEAAKLLGITPMTLRRWEQAEALKPLRIGPRRDRRYKKEELLRLLDKGIER